MVVGAASIVGRLSADKLRNIHLLKMLAVYPAHARPFAAEHNGQRAVLVRLPVAIAGYDSGHYPNARWIGVISGTNPALVSEAIAQALRTADHVPGAWVFKCMDDAALQSVRGYAPVTRATAFVSYTGTPRSAAVSNAPVQMQLTPDAALMNLLLASGGYSREEMLSFFSDADGCGYMIIEHGRPRAACITFAVYEDVYEIAALYTLPDLRRRGYARSLVQAACNCLQVEKRVLRYQAREDNEPSLALARSAGLREFLRLEHWLTDAAL